MGAVQNANYGLLLGDERSPLHLVFRGSTLITRTRSLTRAFVALGRWFDAYHPAPDGLLRLSATAIAASDGRTVLAPRRWLDDLARLEPQLRRHGLRLVDGPFTHVEPATATLVVADLAVTGPLPSADDWPDAPSDHVEPGRYPLVGWVADATVWPGGDDTGPAQVIAELLRLVENSTDRPATELLAAAVALARDVQVTLVDPTSPATLARGVADRLAD